MIFTTYKIVEQFKRIGNLRFQPVQAIITKINLTVLGINCGLIIKAALSNLKASLLMVQWS
ncbi:MAG: hypothetical protein ACI837_003080 [Crocinitomicaceae bacterium]|jgi:hypothetical protein